MNAIVLLTLIPIKRAASASCAVARIALPRRVLVTMKVINARSGIVTAKEKIVVYWICTPEITNSPLGNTEFQVLGPDPFQRIPTN